MDEFITDPEVLRGLTKRVTLKHSVTDAFVIGMSIVGKLPSFIPIMGKVKLKFDFEGRSEKIIGCSILSGSFGYRVRYITISLSGTCLCFGIKGRNDLTISFHTDIPVAGMNQFGGLVKALHDTCHDERPVKPQSIHTWLRANVDPNTI